MPSDSLNISCAVNQTSVLLFQVPRPTKNGASLVVTNVIYILIELHYNTDDFGRG